MFAADLQPEADQKPNVGFQVESMCTLSMHQPGMVLHMQGMKECSIGKLRARQASILPRTCNNASSSSSLDANFFSASALHSNKGVRRLSCSNLHYKCLLAAILEPKEQDAARFYLLQ